VRTWLGSAAGVSWETTVLRAGAASRDITPELRGDFFGYVRPDLRVRGVALRLHAHALVLHDGDRKVAVLTLDLGAPLVTDAILERLAGAGFDTSNLIVAATHTHAGPNRPGDLVADQAAAAVLAAEVALAPARAGWADAPLTDANHNRSLEAHLANHGLDLYPGTGQLHLDPHGPDHPRDTTLRLLRVDHLDGAPLAAWAQFSAHPTTFGPANTSFSADYPRTAIHHFGRRFTGAAPVAIVTNGTEGDLIPRADDVSQHALADRIGRRVAGAMAVAWDAATPTSEVTVDGAATVVGYRGQEVAPGERVADRAWFGLPFLGGAENGPSFLFGLGLQGTRRPAFLADAVHGRKLRAAPAPWPNHAEVTVLRVGSRLLLSVPGEPSVEAGRRMCDAALTAAADAVSVGAALIVGLAHRYRGYFTTPEEYDQQHYEGGHTVFGRHTSRLVEHAHAALTTALTDGTIVLPDGADRVRRCPTAAGVAAAHTVTTVTATGPPSRRLRITAEPAAHVARFDTVTFGWDGARRGHDRPVGDPFLVLQRVDGHRWRDVDDDLGLGFLWQQRGRHATARYEVPGDLPLGRYRFEVRGVRAVTVTRPVEVTPCVGLRVRGAVVEDGVLRFVAQHPPPNPVDHLRSRDRSPRGGTLRFTVGGEEHVATWDDEVDAWTTAVGVPTTVVRVPAGGLVDGRGNRSGPSVDLRPGEVAPLDWPPAIGPGGGRSPALFDRGTRGRPRPWPASPEGPGAR
jgi:neutral ceramidase